MSGSKKKGVRDRWGHVASSVKSVGNETRVCDGQYLGGCTIQNADDLFPEHESYTYESNYYIMQCISSMPKPKYKKDSD